ncbi:MAG TPA: DUF6541 family protein [Gaiellaceae bacterium]|nr:DUF6541 family protein [Gaiellaceae bacterium]
MRHLRWERLAVPVLAAALLGISRLVPEAGFGLWLRLAAATLLVLLPGRLLARALGQRTAAAALAWSTAIVGVGLGLTFSLGRSIDLALGFTLGAGALALIALLLERHLDGPLLPARARTMRAFLLLAGLVIGAAAWNVQGNLSGDAFFHLGRIRKLLDLHELSLHRVGEFKQGGLHPGYAFPLWHGWIALVARLAAVDPTRVAEHEACLLVPLALVLAFETGWAVFRRTGAAVAVVLAVFALKVMAPGHAGVWVFLWEPATAATQLLAPAVIVLFFAFLRKPGWTTALTLAAATAALTLVHPTYALFLALPLAAFVVVRVLLARGADLRRGVAAFTALGIPMALVLLWLEPTVRQTLTLHLGQKGLEKSLHHYRVDLVIHSLTSYNLSPERVDRGGSVAVAALVLTPLALLGRRHRWAALVLGGTVSVLALELWPLVFPHFANAVSLSQARRAATFVPFAFAFAGGVSVVAGFSRLLALAVSLGTGIWLQLDYGGDFGLRAPRTMPSIVVWIALFGGAAAIAAGIVLVWARRDLLLERARRRGLTTALAALLFVLPVLVYGFSNWTRRPSVGTQLTPGLIAFLQHDVPARSVVFANMETGYEAIAYAPVYAVAVPPTHVARTGPNEVERRKHAILRFMADPGLGVPRRWDANVLILSRQTGPVAWARRQGLKLAYRDAHYVVFELPNPALPLRR